MWRDLPYKSIIYSSFGLNIVAVGIIFLLRDLLPPVVPLFYGLPIGADQLIPKLGIFIAPGVGILITIVNIILSHLTSDIFLKRALVVSAAFTTLFITITLTKIVLLVGFF